MSDIGSHEAGLPLASLDGKTVEHVSYTPYASGSGEAMETVSIIFSDGTRLNLYAGSYAIPEEPCIYADIEALEGRAA